MATLKETKLRIRSVKSIQKITKSMKMVAAAKLKVVQSTMEKSRPLYEATKPFFDLPEETFNNQEGIKNVLLVPIGGDKGLCGSANSTIIKKTRAMVQELEEKSKAVSLIVVGDKPRVSLRSKIADRFAFTITQVGARKVASFDECVNVARYIVEYNNNNSAKPFDQAIIMFNKFKSVIAFEATTRNLLSADKFKEKATDVINGYEFDGDQDEIMTNFYEYFVAVTIYNSALEAATSEMSQRMTAMDNATRNAGDVIQRLTIEYNRARQAAITTELIEIISGANAVSK